MLTERLMTFGLFVCTASVRCRALAGVGPGVCERGRLSARRLTTTSIATAASGAEQAECGDDGDTGR